MVASERERIFSEMRRVGPGKRWQRLYDQVMRMDAHTLGDLWTESYNMRHLSEIARNLGKPVDDLGVLTKDFLGEPEAHDVLWRLIDQKYFSLSSKLGIELTDKGAQYFEENLSLFSSYRKPHHMFGNLVLNFR